MHLDVVVLPEIFGLGRYCINELTCLTTAYEAHDIANRTIELMRHTEKMNKLRRGGAGIASRLTIANERRRFTDVLTKLVAEVPSAFLTARST
jgi:hypothetical protein